MNITKDQFHWICPACGQVIHGKKKPHVAADAYFHHTGVHHELPESLDAIHEAIIDDLEYAYEQHKQKEAIREEYHDTQEISTDDPAFAAGAATAHGFGWPFDGDGGPGVGDGERAPLQAAR